MDERSAQAPISRFWSTTALDYEAHKDNVATEGSEEFAAWVEALRTLLPPAPADVLDVGTGTGFAARIAAGLGHRVTGIDLAEGMLGAARSAARSQGVDVDFREGDAVAPPFADASFDAVVSRHLLWTLREPTKAFENWGRLLRAGGRAIAVDGLWFSGESAAEAEGEDAPGLFEQHYTKNVRLELPIMALTSVEPVGDMFRAAGFESVNVSALGTVRVAGRVPYAVVASGWKGTAVGEDARPGS
ncbi:MAG: class I SAM-dependent methyltransferase [Tepidiformaceae bacterium]